MKKINEGLKFEDLKGLVETNIMIDMHKPKIGNEADTVVVTFTVKYEDPANDLCTFIETSSLEHLDTEVSTVPDKENTWKVFVEFQRNDELYQKIAFMLENVDQVTSLRDGDWTYRAYNVKQKRKFNEENFNEDIITSSDEYEDKYLNKDTTDSLNEQWVARIRKNYNI